MHPLKPFALTVFICSLFFTKSFAQSQEKAYGVMLNNFTKNIQWPYISGNTFVIGVLSYTPLADELRNITAQRKVQGKPIEIQELNSIEDASRYQIIFIPAFKSKILLSSVNNLKNVPLLIVTNKPGLAQQGSGINFIMKDGKIQFEINASSIESHGLRVSGNLKALGILVD